MHVRGYGVCTGSVIYPVNIKKKKLKKPIFFDSVLTSIQNAAHIPTICFEYRQNAKIPTNFYSYFRLYYLMLTVDSVKQRVKPS